MNIKPARFHWMPAMYIPGGMRDKPAIVDDFGNLVHINASNTWHSLLQY